MDGVLADFNGEPNSLERFVNEKGFFQLLKETPLCKKLNEALKDNNENVYILSASPNDRADIDKAFWLFEHLPNIKAENIIFVRSGKEKAQYAKGNLLFDDYSDNLLEWEKFGGFGVKVVSGKRNNVKWCKDTLDIMAI